MKFFQLFSPNLSFFSFFFFGLLVRIRCFPQKRASGRNYIRHGRFVHRRDRSSTVVARCLFQAPQHPSTRSRKPVLSPSRGNLVSIAIPQNEILVARATIFQRVPARTRNLYSRHSKMHRGLSAQRRDEYSCFRNARTSHCAAGSTGSRDPVVNPASFEDNFGTR